MVTNLLPWIPSILKLCSYLKLFFFLVKGACLHFSYVLEDCKWCSLNLGYIHNFSLCDDTGNTNQLVKTLLLYICSCPLEVAKFSFVRLLVRIVCTQSEI